MSAKKRKNNSQKYGPSVGNTVKKVMRKKKAGTLQSGRSKKKVKSRKQAIAIALSEARAAGAKVPSKTRRKKRRKKS